MTDQRRPVSFVATQDPERAKAFYGDVMGLKLLEASDFALVFGDGPNTLRVQIVSDFCPASYTAHGWQVTDITRDTKDLAAKGIVFLKFDQMEQDTTGIWTSPDGHKIAWFKDPSGNVLSLTEFV